MGQKEHKAQVKICPTEHSTTMHCSIPLQINSLSRAASFPVFLFPFVSVWNSILQLHSFKSFGVNHWKYIRPISAPQLLSCYSWGKKAMIRYSSSTKDKATLLFKQSFFLPSHTHEPLSKITVASMCLWEVFPLYHSPPPLSPCSSAPPSKGFALIFPASLHVHCFTPPHLFNVLLKKVLTKVLYCLLDILLFSTVKVPGITKFQQVAF